MKLRRFLLVGAVALAFTTSFAGAQPPAVQTVPVNGAATLEIDVQGGDLVAVPDAFLKVVQIHTASNGGLAPARFGVVHAGSQVTLSIKAPEAAILPLSGGGYVFEVHYPPALALKIRQYRGSVTLANARAPVEIYDENGSVSVDDPYASVAAEAVSGNIRIRNARTSIEVTADDGDVEAQLAPSWSGRLVRLEAATGNLQLSVPPGFRARFDVSAQNGNVSNALASSPKAPLVFMLAENGNAAVNVGPP